MSAWRCALPTRARSSACSSPWSLVLRTTWTNGALVHSASRDGATWTSSALAAVSSISTDDGVGLGDYIGLAVVGSQTYVAAGDNLAGNTRIRFLRIRDR